MTIISPYLNGNLQINYICRYSLYMERSKFSIGVYIKPRDARYSVRKRRACSCPACSPAHLCAAGRTLNEHLAWRARSPWLLRLRFEWHMGGDGVSDWLWCKLQCQPGCRLAGSPELRGGKGRHGVIRLFREGECLLFLRYSKQVCRHTMAGD